MRIYRFGTAQSWLYTKKRTYSELGGSFHRNLYEALGHSFTTHTHLWVYEGSKLIASGNVMRDLAAVAKLYTKSVVEDTIHFRAYCYFWEMKDKKRAHNFLKKLLLPKLGLEP